MSTVIYFLCFLLFIIGLYCVVVKKNLLKIGIGLTLMEYSVSLFIVLLGYRWGAHVPVIDPSMPGWTYVNPLPQAVVVTLVVLGLSSLIVYVSLCVRLFEKYGTLNITEIRKLRG